MSRNPNEQQREQEQRQAKPADAQTAEKREDGGAKTAETDTDGIRYFEGTIAKVKKNEDGDEVVVMSDHVMPGERLKSEVDAEKAEEKAKAAEADKNKK